MNWCWSDFVFVFVSVCVFVFFIVYNLNNLYVAQMVLLLGGLVGGWSDSAVAGEEVTDHFQSANFLSSTAEALITGATIQPSSFLIVKHQYINKWLIKC